MIKQIRRVISLVTLACSATFIAGCTTAGPFVTNISSDGRGGIIVEKNTVRMNAFTGAVSTGETPTTQVIRLVAEPEQRAK